MNDAFEISHTELNWLLDDALNGTMSPDKNRLQSRRSAPKPYGSVWGRGNVKTLGSVHQRRQLRRHKIRTRTLCESILVAPPNRCQGIQKYRPVGENPLIRWMQSADAYGASGSRLRRLAKYWVGDLPSAFLNMVINAVTES